MESVIVISTSIVAYLIGSISSAVIISKIISGKDIRNEGSGNAGATNMLRVHGKGAGALTLVIDILKGVAAILVAMFFEWFFGPELPERTLQYVAGLFVVIGHDFPVFFKFKGGKGVATSLGVILMLNWVIGVSVLLIALLIMIITRYVSLGSVASAVIYVVLITVYMLAEGPFSWVWLGSSVIMALLLILKHKSNIKRLRNGTENRLFSKKNKED